FQGKLSVLDTTTNQVVATVPSGSNSALVAVNPTSNHYYFTNTMIGNVSVIDGVTNQVITTIPTGSPPVGTLGIAVNPTTNRIFAASFSQGKNNLVILDGSTNRVVATIPLTGSANQLAVNPTTGRVYVAIGQGNSVAVVQDTVGVNQPSPSPAAQATGLAVPPQLPRTGGLSLALLAVIGMSLLGLGLGARRRH
ncbi:MAG TPA: YncE family protein, partial [Chloroflexota bacterium]|nr:YncE family protein [Chloroflexota bacterium]